MSDAPLRMRTTTIDASPAAMGRFLRQLGDDIELADGDIVLIGLAVYANEHEPLDRGEWVVQTIVDASAPEEGATDERIYDHGEDYR